MCCLSHPSVVNSVLNWKTIDDDSKTQEPRAKSLTSQLCLHSDAGNRKANEETMLGSTTAVGGLNEDVGFRISLNPKP